MLDARHATDENGEHVGVTLDIKEYERLLVAPEDLQDLRAADETLYAIARREDEPNPWEQIRDEISSEYEDPKHS